MCGALASICNGCEKYSRKTFEQSCQNLSTRIQSLKKASSTSLIVQWTAVPGFNYSDFNYTVVVATQAISDCNGGVLGNSPVSKLLLKNMNCVCIKTFCTRAGEPELEPELGAPEPSIFLGAGVGAGAVIWICRGAGAGAGAINETISSGSE